MKKTIVAIASVGVIVALAPLGLKTFTNKIIEKRVDELKTNGIKLDIINSKGYLESTREFVLKIEDEIKFKNLVKQQLFAKYPAYKNLIEEIFQKDSTQFDEFLRGIVFKGDISNSNIDFQSDIKVNTYLHKFSDEIMEKIKKDEESKKVILPFLQKQGLSALMTYSSEGVLKDFRLKDIDEEIKTKDTFGKEVLTDIKFLGYKITNRSNNERVIADINLDDFILEVKSKDDSKLSLANLTYNINYKNELESMGLLNFEKFNFTNNSDGITLGKTMIEAKGEAFTDNYSSSGKLKTNAFHANTPKGVVDIDSLSLNINLDNIDYPSLKKVNHSYVKLQSLSIEPTMTKIQKDMALENVAQPMLDALNSLINKGFLVDLNIDLKNFKNENLKLKSINLDLNAALNKNSINLKQLNNQSLLSEIDATVYISMFSTDMNNIFKVINPQIAMMLSMYAKEENNKVIYDIELSKGKISVNGKYLN